MYGNVKVVSTGIVDLFLSLWYDYHEVNYMADTACPLRVIMTYDDYAELPADRNRYEVIEGEIQVNPAPDLLHQKVSRNLQYVLMQHIRAGQCGELFNAPVDVILEYTSVVQPDLVFISHERQHILTRRAVEGAPDLMVEILSPYSGKIDRVAKFQLYAKHVIPWYWIVDPRKKSIEEYVCADSRFTLHSRTVKNGIFRPALFPGLEILLEQVWDF